MMRDKTTMLKISRQALTEVVSGLEVIGEREGYQSEVVDNQKVMKGA